MRVVHVITGLQQGGAEAMLEKLLFAGRSRDPQIVQSVVCLGESGVVGARLQRAGFDVRVVGLRPGSIRAAGGLRVLGRAMRRRGDEAVIVQTWLWHADLIGGMYARLHGNRKVVWNVRNSMPSLATTKRASRAVAWLCARLSRSLPLRIVCNSHAALRTHVAIGYDAARCVVIPNGFDLSAFGRDNGARRQVRSAWGIGEGELVVGMVARVDPQKDHATFIRAAKRVRQHLPQVRFALVGAGVPSNPDIGGLLQALDLSGAFVLEDRREDIRGIMSALDLFCLASRSEGFPNVLGEAMACGTPAVATAAGDAAEILDDERLVCPVGNPVALAACMRGVLEMSAEERSALGVAQRRSVEKRFDIDRVWMRYRELYESL